MTRRVVAFIAAVVALTLVALPSTAAASSSKELVFQIELRPVSGDVHELPDGVNYGQSQLAGSTTWGGRPAKVEWMCSHVTTNGVGPAHDLVTITRSDGAVLALAVNGRIADATLRGKVEVIGGKGAYRGATGTGTVVGTTGMATMTLNVTKAAGSRSDVRSKELVGC